ERSEAVLSRERLSSDDERAEGEQQRANPDRPGEERCGAADRRYRERASLQTSVHGLIPNRQRPPDGYRKQLAHDLRKKEVVREGAENISPRCKDQHDSGNRQRHPWRAAWHHACRDQEHEPSLERDGEREEWIRSTEAADAGPCASKRGKEL